MDSSALLHFTNKKRTKNKSGSILVDSFIRRGIDVVASAFGLLLLSPVFLVVAVLIKLDSPGPIFYRGPRLGKDGKQFGILKFRTMYETKDSYQGPKVTGAGDHRITRIGQLLRDTKLNELPQLWNVLVGEMSLVGPRPEDPDIAADWEKDVRDVLLSVRPGITSPASIQYRDEEDLLSSGNLMEDYLKKILPSKLRLDSLFVQRRTIISDLDVILLTLINILPMNRKKQIHESNLYHGPLNKLVNRHVIWFIADSVITFVTMAIIGAIWRITEPLDAGVFCAIQFAVLTSLIFSAINMALGLHKIAWASARGVLVFDLGFSTVLSTGVVLIINHLRWMPGHLPPMLLMLAGPLSFFGFAAIRYRHRIWNAISARYAKQTEKSIQMFKERVLIIGAGEFGGMASWLINHGDFSRSFSVIGYLDDDPEKNGMVIDDAPVLGMTSEINSIIKERDIALVVFAINRISDEKRDRIIQLCKNAGINCFVFPRIFDLMMSSATHENTEYLNADHCLFKIEELINNGQSELALKEIETYRKQFAFQE